MNYNFNFEVCVLAFMRSQITEIENRLTGLPLKVFLAAVKSFAQVDNPLRVNNFAMNLRELSRLVLHALSPDDEVRKCCWFEEEFNERGKPIITRGQRIRYAVQAGLTNDFVRDHLLIDVPSIIKQHGEIVDRLSSFTHVGESTFDVDEDAAGEFAVGALNIFVELLQMMDECRLEVHRALEQVAHDALNDEMISYTIRELDELATHHTVEYAYIERFKLTNLDAETIRFNASGSVDCELQYGSDGDYERGDGVRLKDNFPLSCEFQGQVTTPLDLKVKALQVDNSSFYE